MSSRLPSLSFGVLRFSFLHPLSEGNFDLKHERARV